LEACFGGFLQQHRHKQQQTQSKNLQRYFQKCGQQLQQQQQIDEQQHENVQQQSESTCLKHTWMKRYDVSGEKKMN
jgi:hypothetical protein